MKDMCTLPDAELKLNNSFAPAPPQVPPETLRVWDVSLISRSFHGLLSITLSRSAPSSKNLARSEIVAPGATMLHSQWPIFFFNLPDPSVMAPENILISRADSQHSPEHEMCGGCMYLPGSQAAHVDAPSPS